MSEISDKSEKFLLNYSNLFWVRFLFGHCASLAPSCHKVIWSEQFCTRLQI